MRWTHLFASTLLVCGRVQSASGKPDFRATNLRHIQRNLKMPPALARAPQEPRHALRQRQEEEDIWAKSNSTFLTDKTKKFAVDGTAIPEVSFDTGESYAGLLPIGDDPGDGELFFWFFPTQNQTVGKEIVIWLNGGPGCSSMAGLLQENGPFQWQIGTFKPVENPWSWHTLTNVIWIDQPVGTGYSQGNVTATSEEDVAKQFRGFWKNFVSAFDLQGYDVYLTGESYAGMYCPYIATDMLDQNDTDYYNVKGMMIYDPYIAVEMIAENIPILDFVNYWGGLFPFNDTFRADIEARAADCGFSAYMDEFLVYPPSGQQPSDPPGTGNYSCEILFSDIEYATLLINGCFDIYNAAATCPILYDVLGFPGSFFFTPNGSGPVYFDRPDVKKAINVPTDTPWTVCNADGVLVNHTDTSLPSIIHAIPSVIDRTGNVIIAHGALDVILLANGTLLALQNMTWGDKMGFQEKPHEPLYVPYSNKLNEDLATTAGEGVMGTQHTERGLTYVGVALSGHSVPGYQPSVAFRLLEYMLGRVNSLNGTEPFTTDPDTAQSDQPLGEGTAPPGFAVQR